MLRANKDRSQGTRTRATWRRARVNFCPPSVYPDSWEVEPPGTRWEVPPVRETDRLKPRQHHGADSKEPLGLFELDPGGSRRQRGGLGAIKRTSYTGLRKRGLRWSTESLSLTQDPCLHSGGQLRTRKEQLRKRV